MTHEHVNWKEGVDWSAPVEKVFEYYNVRPKLKFGPNMENKAFPVIGHLCAAGEATRSNLMNKYRLDKKDNMMAILSNVTMAIQGSKKVWRPEDGGWYKSVDTGSDLTYVVCPKFAQAWNEK